MEVAATTINQYRTPYEKYILKNIDEEKKNLDNLYNEFAKSGSINKQLLKRKINETIENIELLKKELEKYRMGLSWLREPSKIRDEKAEHLEKIPEEPQQAATPVATPSTPAGRPTVGTPRPSVGTPIGSKPIVGTPSPQPQAGTPAARPTVGTPVGQPRPQVGTPIGSRPQVGTPKPAAASEKKEGEEDKSKESEDAPTS
jgi:hypothetical protein